jgi:hypothetical protein
MRNTQIPKQEKNLRRQLFLASVFFDVKKAEVIKKITAKRIMPPSPQSRIQQLDPKENTFVIENEKTSNTYVTLLKELTDSRTALTFVNKDKSLAGLCMSSFWCFKDETQLAYEGTVFKCERQLKKDKRLYPQLAKLLKKHAADNNMQAFLDDAATILKEGDGLSPAQSIEAELEKIAHARGRSGHQAKVLELMVTTPDGDNSFHPFGVIPS